MKNKGKKAVTTTKNHQQKENKNKTITNKQTNKKSKENQIRKKKKKHKKKTITNKQKNKKSQIKESKQTRFINDICAMDNSKCIRQF